MLVVISILGILAAVVSMSMVGITSLARQRALQDEQMQIQGAVTLMIADQQVDPDQACSSYSGPPGGTKDMSQFPSSLPFLGGASDGVQTNHKPVQLYNRYVHTRFTQRKYVCTSNGQVDPAP